MGLHYWGMKPKPKRYQNQDCLHFITFSCYRRKLLDSIAARDLFERQLERVCQWQGSISGASPPSRKQRGKGKATR